MSKVRLLSAAEQVATHLREELMRGRWKGTMPGEASLSVEVGVNHKTVESALRILEREGLLVSQGRRRPRRIELPEDGSIARQLRVALLMHESSDQRLEYFIELHHELIEAGFLAFYPRRSQVELGMDPERIAHLVKRTEADAWLVSAGSREVLEWFVEQPLPTFALFGRRRGLPIASAGPNKAPAYVALTRRLVELGHQRIVLLCREVRRKPEPGILERTFLDEMVRLGVQPGPYNLPDWEETPEGLHQCLESLFRVTPPTAIIVDEPPMLFTALQYLGSRGLRVPEDVSLVCTDPDSSFEWAKPSVAHINWNCGPWVKRVVEWAVKVSRGEEDTRQNLSKANFVEGGTMGPVKGSTKRRG